MVSRRSLKIFASLPAGAGLYFLLFSTGIFGDQLAAPDMEPWHPFWNEYFSSIFFIKFEFFEFFFFLGSVKVMATLLFWSSSPVVERFGNFLLIFPAGLGLVMNYTIGDPVLPPALWSLVNLYLFFSKEERMEMKKNK